MFHRKDAVLVAVASLLASAGFASAANETSLSLDPTVIRADDAASQGLLMQGLDKVGVGKTLADANLNIYGWVESGYTYNHRHGTGSGSTLIVPGPFNHQWGDHYMLNQVDLRFERQVSGDKFDVGGMVELMYGSDAARIHSTGLGYNGSDATDDGSPADDFTTFANLHPIWQFDIPQAYVDVSVGGNLKFRVGKFVTLLGYETIDPRTNPFYSHSYLFSAVPFTHTGVLGMYQINDQWAVTAGITRGWDIATEDTNGCSIDTIGQLAYTPNKQWKVLLNWSVGPENVGDSSHYRVAIDPIVMWQVTEQLSVGVEGLYVYDGGINGSEGVTHAYGDVWGAAAYAGYKINDNFTVNGRVEKAHTYLSSFGGLPISSVFGGVPTLNAYEFTLGVTITPMPKDPYLKGLVVRPEIRYDVSEDSIFPANDGVHKDQLTFGADVIFQF